MSQTPQKRFRSGVLLWILLLLPIVLVLGITPLLLYSSYASSNAQFEISSQGLRISGSMYGRLVPRKALLVQDSRIVNMAAEPAFQPTVRTNGTSVPGFDEGWFRLTDGHKALLLVTNRHQVVYIPTTEGFVILLSPTRPDFFLSTLQHGVTAPAGFRIAARSSAAATWLTILPVLPLVLVTILLAPIAAVGLKQSRVWSQPTGPGILYADRLVEISDEAILFRDYYFPFGTRRVAFADIERIQARPATLMTGKWRVWGTGDFVTWFPADWYRPSRDTVFLLIKKRGTLRIGFTVEDSAKVKAILHTKGLFREA